MTEREEVTIVMLVLALIIMWLGGYFFGHSAGRMAEKNADNVRKTELREEIKLRAKK